MKGQMIARSYARALVELGEEQKIDVAEELTKLQILINENNSFENVLFLDIFTVEEKLNVLSDVLKKIGAKDLLQSFLQFLVQEKRINLLPLVYKEVMVIDDAKKGFMKAVVEGSEAQINDEDKERISSFLSKKLGLTPKIEYKQKSALTAGYRITAEDLQLDATIDHQFDILKHSILGD